MYEFTRAFSRLPVRDYYSFRDYLVNSILNNSVSEGPIRFVGVFCYIFIIQVKRPEISEMGYRPLYEFN